VIYIENVKVFRCRICGDPYIGVTPPTRCPFCGASQKFFVNAEDWNDDEFNVNLSDISKKNLESALKLELGNTAFYDCAKNVVDNKKDAYSFAKFKALMKVEREHASTISKFLKIAVPEIETDHLNLHSEKLKK